MVTSLALPDAPWPGKMVYVKDIKRLLIFNKDVTDENDMGEWEVAGPGVTFVQADPPEDTPAGTLQLGDQWLDTDTETVNMWRVISYDEFDQPTYGWLPVLVDNPYVDLRASAATSIPHNALLFTQVALLNPVHVDTSYYTVTGSVVTILVSALYDINAMLGFASGIYYPQFSVCINGLAFTTNDLVGNNPGSKVDTSTWKATVSLDHYPLTAGDQLQIGAYQFHNSAIALNTLTQFTRLMIRKVG